MAYTREGAALAPLMDRDADKARRRPFEEAAAAWHSPVPETLVERAQRLGWTRSETSASLRAAPLPPRIRARQAHGMSMDQHAARTRAQRLSATRRDELDDLVGKVRGKLADDVERLYVIDQLRGPERGRGRPTVSDQERKQWLADAERLGWAGVRRLSPEHEDYPRAQDRHTDDFLAPRRSVHRRPTHGRLASCGN